MVGLGPVVSDLLCSVGFSGGLSSYIPVAPASVVALSPSPALHSVKLYIWLHHLLLLLFLFFLSVSPLYPCLLDKHTSHAWILFSSLIKQPIGCLAVWHSSRIHPASSCNNHASILSVLLYGCETWLPSTDWSRHFDAYHRTCLCCTLGIHWFKFVTNKELYLWRSLSREGSCGCWGMEPVWTAMSQQREH